MHVAIVVAAGQGRRMGFKKQFINLAGEPMWLRSVDAMLQAGAKCVIVVTGEDDISAMQQTLASQRRGAHCTVIAGGATRHASVTAGMRYVMDDVVKDNVAPDEVVVAVHDAARPFVSSNDVFRLFQQAAQAGAAILGRACRDTVKLVQGETVKETVPRDNLFLAETPQVIRGDIIEQAYFYEANERTSPTDDSSLLESLQIPVTCIESSSFNGKVTTPDDLEYAYWLANKRWGGGEAT